jgi:hypothetical protein
MEKPRISAAAILAILAVLLLPVWPAAEPVYAALDDIDPNGDGSNGNWNSTAAAYSSEIDEGVRQPDVPVLTDFINADAATGGSYFARMSTIGPDIYMVTRIRVRVYHNDGTNGRVNVQLFDEDESTALSSEITIARNNNTNGWDLADFTGLQILPSQFDNLAIRLRTSLHNGSNPSTNVTVHAMYGQVTYDQLPRSRQAAYRFFANQNSADVGAPMGAQDSNIVLPTNGADFRLRVLLDVTRASIPQNMESFKLQFVDSGTGSCANPAGGNPSAYIDVTGSTAIAFNDNGAVADEAALTINANDPIHDADATISQSYQEANNFSNNINDIPITESAMWDFSLTDNTAPNETSYCFRIVAPDGSEIFAYDQYPVVTTAGGMLSVDVVDAAGDPVASPSRNLTAAGFNFDCTATTGQIGVNAQRVRVTNGTGNPEWTLTIAATGGPTDSWSDGAEQYDFNDPGGSPAGCSDGGDSDSLAGQLSFILGSVNITPEGGCSSTGLSSGSNASFEESVTDSVTLMVASSSADAGCFWDFRNFDVSQQIPREQIEGNYDINLTVTVTAV